MPKVYNKRDKDIPTDAVYVGRPSKWGNPYKIGSCYSIWLSRKSIPFTNEDAVRAYRQHVEGRHEEIKTTLKGKDLVCWCSPLPCHADVLLEIANNG